MKLHSSLAFLLAAAATSTSMTARATSNLRGNTYYQQAAQEDNAIQRELLSEPIPEPIPEPVPNSNKFGLVAHQLGRVHTLNGDHWEMNSSGDNGWTEFKADGKKTFKWKEADRDVNSVYLLQDDSRHGEKTTARIDLYYGTIVYCYQQNNCFDLRTITSAHKINKFGLSAENLSNVVVQNGDHWVLNGNTGVWTESQVNGQYLSHWMESHHDLHSVYLKEYYGQNPGATVQIDLYAGEIIYCVQTGNCFTLHDILAAY